jgi:hypothetical protein
MAPGAFRSRTFAPSLRRRVLPTTSFRPRARLPRGPRARWSTSTGPPPSKLAAATTCASQRGGRQRRPVCIARTPRAGLRPRCRAGSARRRSRVPMGNLSTLLFASVAATLFFIRPAAAAGWRCAISDWLMLAVLAVVRRRRSVCRMGALVVALLGSAACAGRTTGSASSAGAAAPSPDAGPHVGDTESGTPTGNVGSVLPDSDGGHPCLDGCLCFTTPDTCPNTCFRGQRQDGTFVCGYPCQGANVPCNCVYHPADGGIYVCDTFTIRACPSTNPFSGAPMGACDPAQGGCMSCGGSAGPMTCACSDAGPIFGVVDEAGLGWACGGTEQACKGP